MHNVKIVGRINWRFYLVEIMNQYYILDYINPRDIKTFLFITFNANYDIYKLSSIDKIKYHKLSKLELMLERKYGRVLLILLLLSIIPITRNIMYFKQLHSTTAEMMWIPICCIWMIAFYIFFALNSRSPKNLDGEL